MRLIATNSALERMTRRGIGMPSVAATVLHGRLVHRQQDASEAYPRLTYALDELHVVVTQDGITQEPVVVTAFWQQSPAEAARIWARRMERRAQRNRRRARFN